MTALFCFHNDIHLPGEGHWSRFSWELFIPRNKRCFKDSGTFLQNRWCTLTDLISFDPEHIRFLLWFCLQGNWSLKYAKICAAWKTLQSFCCLAWKHLSLVNKCYHCPRSTFRHWPAFGYVFVICVKKSNSSLGKRKLILSKKWQKYHYKDWSFSEHPFSCFILIFSQCFHAI